MVAAKFQNMSTWTMDITGQDYIVHRDEDGRVHRCDGPAVEHSDGTKEWYHHDLRHRSDGPAIEIPDGTTYWYWMSDKHRIDGPAVESTANGEIYVEWWISGQKLKFDEYLSKIDDDDLKLMLTLKYGSCRHSETVRMFLRSPPIDGTMMPAKKS